MTAGSTSMDRVFIKFANHTAKVAGASWTFLLCLAVVIVWALTGPMFGFSQTWQLIINTGTTIVTFLMVFLIQNTQNRDGAAIQAKLDELIHAVSKADERFVGIERLSDKELSAILMQVEARAIALRGDGAPVVATRQQDRRRSAAAGGGARKPPAKGGRKPAATRRGKADA